jgi:hypothetical protein
MACLLFNTRKEYVVALECKLTLGQSSIYLTECRAIYDAREASGIRYS